MSLPEWMGPPASLVGGVVALRLLAARSEDAAVWLESAVAYPTGVEFRLDVRWQPQVQGLVMRGAGPAWPRDQPVGEELPADQFRAGIELADGAKATWLGPGRGVAAFAQRVDESPPGPLLVPGAGGGGSRRWSQHLWLWPLPPPGRLQFVVEWPALGILLTRAELDASQLREAAERTQTLWGDGESGPPPPAPPVSGPV